MANELNQYSSDVISHFGARRLKKLKLWFHMLENYRTVYFITISDVELSIQMKFYFMILLDLMRITKKLRRLQKLFMILK